MVEKHRASPVGAFLPDEEEHRVDELVRVLMRILKQLAEKSTADTR